MKPSIVKLQKIFKLESERGFDDKAVVGGLARILTGWEAEARVDNLSEELIQAVGSRLRDYQRLSPASRQESLQGLWRRLQGKAEATSEEDSNPSPEILISEQLSSTDIPAQRDRAEDVDTIIEDEGQQDYDLQDESSTEDGKVIGENPNTTSTSEILRPSRLAEIPTQDSDSTDTTEVALNAPVTVLSGVGPRHGQTLERLGLKTLGDMLYYFPRRYDDYSTLKPINRLWYGDEVTVIGTIQSIATRKVRSGRAMITEAVVSDGSGALRITWFNPWIAKRVRNEMQVVLSGKIDQYLGRLVMNNPEWEPLESQNLNTSRIVPVYPLTANITQRWLRRVMHQVVSYWAPRLPDPLPENILQKTGLMGISTAIYQAHFPDNQNTLTAARRRLAFDEIFYLQLGMLKQKRAWQDQPARAIPVPDEWLHAEVSQLPFVLTNAQQRALEDVRADFLSGHPMNRLLQGDVGSGKTVIAALAIAMVARAGAQAAIMAPTSILAEQHYQSLQKLICQPGNVPGVVQEPDDETIPPDQATGEASAPETTSLSLASGKDQPPRTELLPDDVRLLLGATSDSEKREIQEGLAGGEIKVVVGTHALIEDPVIFKDLQLAIVDEQHRFGVDQRAALRNKGQNPHLIVMTATPIPRSLALTVYGDLDLSIIDEMPPGRQVVDTYLLAPRLRERAYSLIRRELNQGRQAFIVYPLIEEANQRGIESDMVPDKDLGGNHDDQGTFSSSDNGGKAAVDEYHRLQTTIFPEFKLGLLHGRLKPEEKDEVMARFRNKEYQLLVSTTVVEVGVDVPNATVMLVEGANRFGLAQLHQLRGRVGRGPEKAYCLLIPESEDTAENERLTAMTETNDGFLLAEKDLQQRGPGDFLGTRQSGFAELKMANLVVDVHLIDEARRIAPSLLDRDPELQLPEHAYLAAAVRRFWREGGDIS